MRAYEAQGGKDARWWLDAYREERASAITRVVRRLKEAQASDDDDDLRAARLYGNFPLVGFGPRSYRRRAGSGSRLSFNVVKNCCDAYAAKITKERPKVTFVTSGGEWSLQQRAEANDKFVEGTFYEAGVYATAPLWVLDTAVFGTGWAKTYAKGHGSDERICVDRVPKWEVVFDEEEAVSARPRNIYHTKYLDRAVVQAMFPKLAAEIGTVKRETFDDNETAADSTLSDMIMIVEAWHLRSGPDATDGRWCQVVGDVVLLDEQYDEDSFPLEPIWRQRPLWGMQGISLSWELQGIQKELNVLLEKIQYSHHLLGSGHWVVQKGTVNKQKIDNQIGSIIEWTGSKPELEVGMLVSPEIYQHLDRLYGKAYEITGISQLSAQGLKPAGLDSGEAQRVYLDTQTERFQVSYNEYQDFILRIARQVMRVARQISARNPGFAVKASGSRNRMSKVIFSDNELAEEEYILKLYPTNALSHDPAARIAQVTSFADAGWIDPNDAKRLLDFPDLEAMSNSDNASYNLVQDIISDIRNEGTYSGPEPFMDLKQALKLTQIGYLQAKRDKVPEDRLEMLRQWMTDANDMLAGNQAQLPPPGPTMPGNDNGASPPMGAAPPMPPDAGAPMPPPMPPPPDMPPTGTEGGGMPQ